MTQRKTRVPRCTRACSEMHTFELGCTEYHDPQLEVNYESHRDYELKKRHRERIDMLEPQLAEPVQDEYTFTLMLSPELTHIAQFIVEEILPEYMAYFVRKNIQYHQADGQNVAEELGAAGQWGDIRRKVAMLKGPLWEHRTEPYEFDSVEELLRDLFGHTLLAAYFVRMGIAED